MGPPTLERETGPQDEKATRGRLVGQRHFFSHSRAGGSLLLGVKWIPACAGMTWDLRGNDLEFPEESISGATNLDNDNHRKES